MSFLEILLVVPTIISAGAAIVSHIKGRRYKQAAEETGKAIDTIIVAIEDQQESTKKTTLKKTIYNKAISNGTEKTVIAPAVKRLTK